MDKTIDLQSTLISMLPLTIMIIVFLIINLTIANKLNVKKGMLIFLTIFPLTTFISTLYVCYLAMQKVSERLTVIESKLDI